MDLANTQNHIRIVCSGVTELLRDIESAGIDGVGHETLRLGQSADELKQAVRMLETAEPPDADQMRTLRHDLRNLLGAVTGYGEMILEMIEEMPEPSGQPRLGIRQKCEEVLSATHTTLQLLEQRGAEAAVVRLQSRVPPVEPSDGVTRLPGNLLVIDDSVRNREILGRHLERQGHRVRAVESAALGLKALEEDRFDLILLDLIMPEVDGFQLLTQLKADPVLRAIPVIMVSGIDDTDGVMQCIKAGADDYLTKPFNPVLLEARLSSCLERKRWHDRELAILDELEKRNRFIRRTFGRYLSDEIVNTLLEHPDGLDLGGGYRTVTILMTDIRNFTDLCERLDPERVVKLLNNYLSVMTRVIMAYGGTVDEFIGDAVLALFGAPIQRPDDVDRAIACALSMQLAIEEVNALNTADGLPEICMGIGINTGEVIAGNIGSDKRLKYAVVGRHVNLAARVEAQTEGGQVLASDYTVHGASAPLTITSSGSVQMKGIREEILVHDIRGIGGDYNIVLKPSGSNSSRSRER